MARVINLVAASGIRPDKLRPVGAIYQSVTNTNPATLFGGTWQRYGNGRVIVGLNTADADFNTVGKTGGAKTHVLTVEQMPTHSHTITLNQPSLPSAGSHDHNVLGSALGLRAGDREPAILNGGEQTSGVIEAGGAHSHTVTPRGTVSTTGGGAAHNNLMPYLTAYAWKRVA